jgi:ABC-type oligopeptide transport system substrate-binding subunit
MAKQIVNIGTFLEDPSAESTRSAFNKINQNFDELYRVNVYTSNTLQSVSDFKATVIMKGDNLTYTLQDDLAFSVGDGLEIIQVGNTFTIDHSNVNATLSKALVSTNGSRYLITKTGRANNIDEYVINQLGV